MLTGNGIIMLKIWANYMIDTASASSTIVSFYVRCVAENSHKLCKHAMILNYVFASGIVMSFRNNL